MHLTRTFHFEPKDGSAARPIELTIGDPMPDGDGVWWAPLDVTGFDAAYATKIPGADSLQAVLNAVGVARGFLQGKAERGRLTLDGSEDLGFRLAGSS